MKKSIIVTLLIIALVGGMFALTGCSKGGNVLKAEYSGKEYQLSYKIGAGDEITDDYADYEDMVSIKNAEKNYTVDLALYIDYKDAYEEGKTGAKENLEDYAEVKIGKYDAYTGYSGPGEFFIDILLDTSDDVYKTAQVTLLVNGEATKEDVQELYKSEDVQSIINSINF